MTEPETPQVDPRDTRIDELETELSRLHSWQGLLELLDEHWPTDIIPTGPDSDQRDTGPRLVSALRRIAELEAVVELVRVQSDAAAPAPTAPLPNPRGET